MEVLKVTEKVEQPSVPEKSVAKTEPKKGGRKVKPASAKKKSVNTQVSSESISEKKSTTGKRTTKRKTAVKSESVAKQKKTAQERKFDFSKTVFEFNGKKYDEDVINKLVQGYLDKHPYIHGDKVETFVNVENKKVYFTVDGIGNVDFSIDL